MPPKLYDQLSSWWPLLSPPEEYTEEAAFYARHFLTSGNQPAITILELGSGGGSNAFHLKKHFQMTLVDLSPGMQAVSRRVNPECEHILGDMRTVRLDRQFDRVFIHDAIMYMTTLADLRRAIETAYVHCRPGGAALFAPDFMRESFRPGTDHGGYDGDGRGLRYLEWTWDPDPADSTYIVDYAFLLREKGGAIHVEHDRHIEGLFGRDEWLQLLSEAGFQPSTAPAEHSELPPGTAEVFIGIK